MSKYCSFDTYYCLKVFLLVDFYRKLVFVTRISIGRHICAYTCQEDSHSSSGIELDGSVYDSWSECI